MDLMLRRCSITINSNLARHPQNFLWAIKNKNNEEFTHGGAWRYQQARGTMLIAVIIDLHSETTNGEATCHDVMADFTIKGSTEPIIFNHPSKELAVLVFVHFM